MNNTIFMKVKDLIDKTMDLLLFLKIFLSTFVFFSKKKIVFFFFLLVIPSILFFFSEILHIKNLIHILFPTNLNFLSF